MGIDPVTHSPRLDLLDLSSILMNSSFSSSSHMNFSGMVQPLINPEILRLAASLFSTSRPENENLISSNQSLVQPVVQHELQELTTATATTTTTITNTNTPCVQFSTVDAQSVVPTDWSDYRDGYEYDPHNGVLQPGHYYYGSENVVGPSTDSGFGVLPASVLSTPSSSPTPLNSNSTTYNNWNSSTEDERDSYCSDVFRFEIPDGILDVSNFM
ncbi:Transcription factor MYB102 [Linum grandiflorum]